MKFDERGRPRTRGPSLDHLPRIDSMEWHREGWFSWPWLRLSWGDFAAIKCKPGDSSDILADVLLPSGHFGATIGVDQEKRPLGGFLRWFRCPGCGGRCRYLYLLPARVICRICSRLPYESERVSDFGRLDLRRRKARDRLPWPSGHQRDLP